MEKLTKEELIALLAGEKNRADQEAQRADQEAQRADQEAQRAGQEAQRADQEAQRAGQEAQRGAELHEQRRPTTLLEYIQLCHDHLSTQFHVQADRRLTTQGTWTNPAGKYCPRRLARWDVFLAEQRVALGQVVALLPETMQLFESCDLTRGAGARLAAEPPIGSERDLERFHHSAVELPVRLVIDQLFENHINVLNNSAPPPASATPSTPTRVPPTNDDTTTLIRPDQICVFRSSGGDRTLAYIIEYKAPHKLTAQHVREGIRPLDLLCDVVNRPTIPNSPDDRFRYFADKLSAAAVTQTYHYMLQAGLEIGLVATGEVMIFLKIDWTDPSTLYYHVAEPMPECEDNPPEFLYCTAVSQLLAFTVMALLGSGLHSQDERSRAIANAPTWAVDWEQVLAQVKTPADRIPPSSGRCWEPETYSECDRSPIPYRLPRLPRKKYPAADHRPQSVNQGRDPSPPDDDDGAGNDSNSPSPAGGDGTLGRRPKRKRGAQPGASAAPSDTQARNRRPFSTPPFCTHACLLGLVRGGALDPSCPNTALHQPHGESSSSCGRNHPLHPDNFLELLRQQLHRTLDEGMVPLGRHGARGALFRVTLLSYGYTFVAKGTTSPLARFLKHEAHVYQQLGPAQGVYVPVYLGAVDLRELGRRYFYAADVHVVYLLLLSWAGKDLCEAREQPGVGIQAKVVQSLRNLHALGVAHGDVRRENLVWSREPGDPIMVIDFERSILTKTLRPLEDGGRTILLTPTRGITSSSAHSSSLLDLVASSPSSIGDPISSVPSPA
ncbi:hypothetical protein B0H67DRAFT_635372 [Lasiosphaeris hirsuta]|uniref:Protein kinase domain-containing protein n=1 Tax=Lasiosphaeris hirsuta TaxID=260670 RepID=A0AA40A7L9_9PEZI|nr:hypothetical protein B0H67DRAFT_635372 [Lasiosphaeris hirsuta]